MDDDINAYKSGVSKLVTPEKKLKHNTSQTQQIKRLSFSIKKIFETELKH